MLVLAGSPEIMKLLFLLHKERQLGSVGLFIQPFCVWNTCFHFHSYSSYFNSIRPSCEHSSSLLPHLQHQTALRWACGSGHQAVQPPQGLWLAFSAGGDWLSSAPCANVACLSDVECTPTERDEPASWQFPVEEPQTLSELKLFSERVSLETKPVKWFKTMSCKSVSTWNKCSQKRLPCMK